MALITEPLSVFANAVKHRMLGQPFRNFIIKHKAIFQSAIIAFAKILPEPTKEGCIFENSHTLIEKRDRFLEYENNNGRQEMFQAIWNIFIDENEHDDYYRFRFEWTIEEIIKDILSGKWQPRPQGYPFSEHWNEPQPYGGKHSIVYKLQSKRKEILELIGDEL